MFICRKSFWIIIEDITIPTQYYTHTTHPHTHTHTHLSESLSGSQEDQILLTIGGRLSKWDLWAWGGVEARWGEEGVGKGWKVGMQCRGIVYNCAFLILKAPPLDQRTSGLECAGTRAQNYVGVCCEAQARKVIQHELCQNKTRSDKGVLSVFLGVLTFSTLWFIFLLLWPAFNLEMVASTAQSLPAQPVCPVP